MKTVLELIRTTTAYFEKHGIDNPRLNFEHLLAHSLGMKRMDLYLQFDRPLSEKELGVLRDLVKRRAQGEPLQHLMGTVEFLGRTFRTDKRALIPRPETEQLCEMLVEEAAKSTPPALVLDVGTGSGVIALTLAGEWPEAQVEAVDVSEDALTLAGENAVQLGLQERVRFHRSDLLAGVEGEFDLIVANLPYIPRADLAALQREVQHDPALALDGGAIGSEIIARLILEVTGKLRGKLALEIGHDQTAVLSDLLHQHNFQDIRAVPDYQGRDRFLFATYG